MISKNKIKLIRSLAQKKYRNKENLFLAEGNKLAAEILSSGIKIDTFIATEEFYRTNSGKIPSGFEQIKATQDEIKKCSLLKNPQQALLICKIPERTFNPKLVQEGITLCLDGIQDPGNLGTILRVADWFGIRTICASNNTADVFNPKVVQASMGAILRVKVYYTPLEDILQNAQTEHISTFGAFLSGSNIYSLELPDKAIVVLGNEGNGISPTVEALIKNRLFIPPNVSAGNSSESLNVSVATAIVCSEFMRNKLRSYSK